MECSDICDCLCAYIDGELESERIRCINEHLRTCPICRQEVNLQRCIRDRLRICKEVVAPESLVQKIKDMLERADDFRESGIQILDFIEWGAHIAQLCRTEDDMNELLIPYLEAGLRQNEMCVWVTSQISQEEIKETLGKHIEHIQIYIDNGQLQLVPHEDWYFSEGSFDAKRLVNAGIRKYNEAISRGYDGLRLTGNHFWLDQSSWGDFMDFENRLNDLAMNQKLLILCAFRDDQFTMDKMDDVFSTHQSVICKVDDLWMDRKS